MLSAYCLVAGEVVKSVGRVVVQAVIGKECVLGETPAVVDGVAVLPVELDRLVREELIRVGVGSRSGLTAGEVPLAVSELIGRSIVDVPLQMGLTIVASEEVVASDQGEAQTMLRGKSDIYRCMGVSRLGVVASPAVTRRILYVCSGVGLRGDSPRSPSGDTVRRPGAYGVASIEGLLGFRLLVDDVDDASQSGVTDAHRSGAFEHLDVRYRCHPGQGSRLPKSVALVTHPIGEYH